jgi:hypothetical protein
MPTRYRPHLFAGFLFAISVSCSQPPVEGVIVGVTFQPEKISTVKGKYSLSVKSPACCLLSIVPESTDRADTITISLPSSEFSKYSIGDRYKSK